MLMFIYWRAWMLTSWRRQGACQEYIFQTCFSVKINLINAKWFMWLHSHFCDGNRSVESGGAAASFDSVGCSCSQLKCYCRHSCSISSSKKDIVAAAKGFPSSNFSPPSRDKKGWKLKERSLLCRINKN